MPPDYTATEQEHRFRRAESRLEALEEDGKNSGDLLIRIDERIKILGEDIKAFKDGFVKKEEFEPIKKVVYGAVGLALTAICGVILSLALK